MRCAALLRLTPKATVAHSMTVACELLLWKAERIYTKNFQLKMLTILKYRFTLKKLKGKLKQQKELLFLSD